MRREIEALEHRRQSYCRERAWLERDLSHRADVFARTVRAWTQDAAFRAWRGVVAARRGRSKRLHTLLRRVVDPRSNVLARTFTAWSGFEADAAVERAEEAMAVGTHGVEEETARREAAAAEAQSSRRSWTR